MNNLEGYVNRTEKLKMYQVEAKVLRYIKNRIKNVDFSFWNIEYRPVEELIDQGYLEGWCFQTAEFLQDKGFVDAVVDRRKMKATLSHLLGLHNIEKTELNETSKEVDNNESI